MQFEKFMSILSEQTRLACLSYFTYFGFEIWWIHWISWIRQMFINGVAHYLWIVIFTHMGKWNVWGQVVPGEGVLIFYLSIVIGIFPKRNLNLMNSTNSWNLINVWSMNWDQLKVPVSHICLPGAMVLVSRTRGGKFEPFDDKYF